VRWEVSPCVAKLPVGGYDGKGVRVIASWAEAEEWFALGPVLLEEQVDFRRELAQLGARRPSGEWVAWPVVETRQVNGVCSEVLAPAPGMSAEGARQAESIASTIASAINVVGVLAVELFETADARILVNELAMRPHNSGHVFTELSLTSQFEQHLRAVAGFPLGAPQLIQEFGVMANIFGRLDGHLAKLAAEEFPAVKIHDYQKAPRLWQESWTLCCGRKQCGKYAVRGTRCSSNLGGGQLRWSTWEFLRLPSSWGQILTGPS